MAGLISDDGGAASVDPFDTAQAPAGVTEGQDWLGATQQLIRGAALSQQNEADWVGAQPGTLFGRALGVDQRLSPEEANQQYGGNGLTFSNPVSPDVARMMSEAHQQASLRADAAARAAPGTGLARGAMSLAAGLLDPVNIAASFMPVYGEASVAGALGRAGIGTFGQRLATGALAGAEGQGALALAEQPLLNQEGQDQSFTDVLRETLAGAMFGGVLHPIAGAIHDFIGDRFGGAPAARIAATDPEARNSAASAAIAAVAEDRPVQVDPVLELSARQREQALAMRSLRYDASQNVALRLNAVEDDLTRPGEPLPADLEANLSEQRAALQDIAQSQGDIAAIGTMPADPATLDRLTAIDEELTRPGPLSGQRADVLMAERQMLTEGETPRTQADMELQAARDEAQRRGNETAIARNNDRIAELQDQIRRSATVQEALGAGAPEAVKVSALAEKATAEARPPAIEEIPPAPDTNEMADLENAARAAVERGEISQSDLDAITDAGQDAEARAKAHEAFGQCMAGAV